MKKLFSIITALALCLTLLPTAALAEGGVSYIDRSWDNINHVVTDTEKSCTVYTQVESDTTAWNNSWYVVKETVTINDRVTVSGDVHLILTDGCNLTVNGGINVSDGNSLTIYAQSTGYDMGTLIATASAGAGIGGVLNSMSGAITINGGNITANGGTSENRYGGAGIGSGGLAESGQITINGGNIVATGSDGSYGAGAGIGGGGNSSHATNIVITGGTITATAGANGAAGIGGGGHDGELKSITITGGDITATGTYKHNEPGNGNANAIGGGAGRAAADMGSFQNCVIKDGASQTVVFCGEDGVFTLTEDYTIASGCTLRIQEGTRFVVDNNVTLTNNGTFVHSGMLENNGRIIGNGTVTHVVGQRTSVSNEEHEGTCGCGETIREAHGYSTVVENDSFVMDCGQCDAERTISVSEVVQTPSIYEDGQTAKLSVAVTASDNHEVSGLSYQWQKENAVTSVAPNSKEEEPQDIEVLYTVPEGGGAIAFQYTATRSIDFNYFLSGPISKSEFVLALGNETKTVWFTDLPGGSYTLEIMVFGGEGIEFSFDSQPYKPYVAIPEATASECTFTSYFPYKSGDKYRVQVTLNGQTLTRDYTLPATVEITGIETANGIYDGQAHTGYTGTPVATGYSGEFEVSYQKKQADGSYTDLADAPTAVGTYRVKLSFVGDGIYGTKTLEFSVGKADSTLTFSADSGSVSYNGTTTFTVTENTSGGALSVASSDETVAAAVLDGNTITVSGKKVGTATITVTSAETDNYNGAVAQYEVTVSQDGNAWIIPPAITGWTAGDIANAPTYEAKYGNDTAVVEYKKADVADDTYTTTVPTAAGTYKVRVSVAATTDYAGLSAILDLTIVPQETAFNCTVSFNANGGTGEMIPATVAAGASYQLPESTFTAPADKAFDKWALNDADSLNYYEVGDVYIVNANTVFYAIWEAVEPATYTVTVSNGGTGASGSGTYAEGDTVTITAGTKNNYSFGGWTSSNGVTFANAISATTTFTIPGNDVTVTANWTYLGGGGGDTASSTTTTTTTKNPDGSTTTTVTNKNTGTVTETTKNTDGSTTIVETKKDGMVTETNKTADGTTGTVVTDKNGSVTEITASVSDKAAKEAAKTGEAVILPVEVPASTNRKDAPIVEVTLPKNSGSVKVEIPVEKVTPGTVAIIVRADGTEEIVSTSIPTENGVTLTVGGSTTVKIVDNAKVFSDVPANSYFNDAVAFSSARGITGGTSSTTFSPDTSCTRAQIVTFLWRAAGSPVVTYDMDFSDVSADAYYADAVRWAVSMGITTGTGNGTFSPDATCTRAQAMTFIYRNEQAQGGGMQGAWMIQNPFADVNLENYYGEAVMWAVINSVTNGTGATTFSPNANCTRAQIVTFLYNYLVE